MSILPLYLSCFQDVMLGLCFYSYLVLLFFIITEFGGIRMCVDPFSGERWPECLFPNDRAEICSVPYPNHYTIMAFTAPVLMIHQHMPLVTYCNSPDF